MSENQRGLIVLNGINYCSQILGMSVEAKWPAISRLLIAPPVVCDYSEMIHTSGHPGKRSASVETAMHTNDGRLRIICCSLPDSEVGKLAKDEGREAVGGRIDGSDA